MAHNALVYIVLDACYDTSCSASINGVMLHLAPKAYIDSACKVDATAEAIQREIRELGRAKIYYATDSDWHLKITRHRVNLIQKLGPSKRALMQKMLPGMHGNGAVDMYSNRLSPRGWNSRKAALKRLQDAGLVRASSNSSSFYALTDAGVDALRTGYY